MGMTAESFAYWLQGFVELGGRRYPSNAQWDLIVEHLGLVFDKVTKPVAEPVVTDWDEYLKKMLPKETDKGFTPDWYKHYVAPVESDGKKFVLTC